MRIIRSIKLLLKWLLYFIIVFFLYNIIKVVNLYMLFDMVEGGLGCLVYFDFCYYVEERCCYYWVFLNNFLF